MIPRASADYYRRQQRITLRLLLALRRVWRRMEARARWEEQYREDGVGAQMLMLVTAAQVAAARDADTYIAEVLNELAFGPKTAPGVLVPTAFAGVTGDGRSVSGLLAQSVVHAGKSFNRDYHQTLDTARANLVAEERVAGRVREAADSSEMAPEVLEADIRLRAARDSVRQLERRTDEAAEQALADTMRWIEMGAATIIADTARAAEAAAAAERPWVGGYVRMLNPPSCSRCVVLAGKFYLWNEGFKRHPLCDCRHIPAPENMAGDLLTTPDAYFESLSRADQDKYFTKAGAHAIRDGADITQVVNARRGMATAGESLTRAGVTPDGRATRVNVSVARAARNADGSLTTSARATARRPRLMPESIYEIADGDRAEAIRLLKLHGFLIP